MTEKTEIPTTDDGDPVDTVTHNQPTLPTFELPDYHGRKPVGMKSSVNGASNRLTRPHGIGDRIVVVAEAVVKRAGHEQTDDGLIYAETLKIEDMFEAHGDVGQRLLTTMKGLQRAAEDAHTGRTPLADRGENLGDVGYTDASGVVLTPAELADLRGDPVAAMMDPKLTPVVVVYASGTKLVWPDEFNATEPRPTVGMAHPDDHEEGVDADRVVKLLHHATGEEFDDGDVWAGSPEDHRPTDTEPDDTADDGDVVGYAGEDIADGVPAIDDGVPAMDAPPALSVVEGGMSTDPTPHDFEFVDCGIPELKAKLVDVGDLVLLDRALNAEKAGRGRGLKVREGAIAAIKTQIAKVGR